MWDFEMWYESVENKNSILCAGVDPDGAHSGLTRSLPFGMYKRDWALSYVENIAPHVAAIKPNLKYWLRPSRETEDGIADIDSLADIIDLASTLSMPVILDAKFADIGKSLASGLHNVSSLAHLITIAPSDRSMKNAISIAHEHDLGAIPMVLMSSPGFAIAKYAWEPVSGIGYDPEDMELIRGKLHVHRYLQLAHDARVFGADGVVIGASTPQHEILEEEVRGVHKYLGDHALILTPGIGAQGGNPLMNLHYFGDRVIASASTSLMFPKGRESTPSDQLHAALRAKNWLNSLRDKSQGR